MEGATESRVRAMEDTEYFPGGWRGKGGGSVGEEGARLVGRGCLEELVDWRLKIQFNSMSAGVVQPGVIAVAAVAAVAAAIPATAVTGVTVANSSQIQGSTRLDLKRDCSQLKRAGRRGGRRATRIGGKENKCVRGGREREVNGRRRGCCGHG